MSVSAAPTVSVTVPSSAAGSSPSSEPVTARTSYQGRATLSRVRPAPLQHPHVRAGGAVHHRWLHDDSLPGLRLPFDVSDAEAGRSLLACRPRQVVKGTHELAGRAGNVRVRVRTVVNGADVATVQVIGANLEGGEVVRPHPLTLGDHEREGHLFDVAILDGRGEYLHVAALQVHP